LTVIRDSFHEALVSRVLWILLAISTLLLAALLPLGFIEQAGSVLREEDFLNREKLIERLVAQGKSRELSPGRRIWELLDSSVRQSLETKPTGPFEARERNRSLERGLQGVIDRRDMFRESDWAKVTLPSAARALAAKGLDTLASDELARFNRLALEAAYPSEIAPISPKQIQLAYFSWELGLPLPVEPEQLFPAINQVVVTTLSTLLGVAGVFVAVLVTASMIPQTFEAGSVDLLLSKPIYRTWLFLAKFFGGCAFIAINAAYFIGGLWLVLGVRFGLWNQRLLWAIPLYLFLFAIYYGVSALAGLVWRNAIVSVVLAVVFWFVCWSLGTANTLVEAISLDPRRMTAIVRAGDEVIAANQGETFRWDELRGDWQPIFAARNDNQFPFMFRQRRVGPLYDATGQRILAFNTAFPGLPLRAANRLQIGKRSDDWRRSEGVTLPEGAFGLFIGRRADVLVVASHGIYRLEGNPEARQGDINVFGLHIPLPQNGGRFANVGPSIQLRPLQSAAIDPQTDTIALFDGFRLVLFERDAAGAYRQGNDQVFEHKQTGEVALGGGQVFLALGEREIRRYSAQLMPLELLSTGLASAADSTMVSPDGRYLAIVTRSARLWLYDIRESRPALLDLVGQGDISAVAFEGQEMYVADRLTRVTQYNLEKLQSDTQWQGSMPLAERIYRYALHPLYTVFPKPSQLNETVNYVLTSKEAPAGSLRLDDGNPNAPLKVDVWGPVWSNSAFLIVVLAAACLYVHRKDF
jgi:hypothetical protein